MDLSEPQRQFPVSYRVFHPGVLRFASGVPSDHKNRAFDFAVANFSIIMAELMKILIFTSLFPNCEQPDFGIFVFQRILHLARRPGALVQVVAPVRTFPRGSPLVAGRSMACSPARKALRIFESTSPLPLASRTPNAATRPSDVCGVFFARSATASSIRFDCIDAHYVYPDGFAAALLGKLLGLPVVVSARGSDINVFPSFPSIRPLIVWSLRKAVGIIAVSNSLKNAMVIWLTRFENLCNSQRSGYKSVSSNSSNGSATDLGTPEGCKNCCICRFIDAGKNHPC